MVRREAMIYAICCLLCSCAFGSSSPNSGGDGPGSPISADDKTQRKPSECLVPTGLIYEASQDIGTPRIVETTARIDVRNDVGIEVAVQQIGLTLDADGGLSVTASLRLRNPGDSPAEAVIGYGWRVPEVADPPTFPANNIELELDSENAISRKCIVSGPRGVVQPYVEMGHWAEVHLSAGQEVEVTSAYTARARQARWPVTLFGQADRFALNWKNHEWPYTKSEEYASIADRLKPFHGSLVLGPAHETHILIRNERGDEWLRSLSHEQHLQKERTRGTYSWKFDERTLPNRVGFEYVSGLPIAEEIDVFSAIVKARPWDLRAHIRLADLHYFGGDTETRAGAIRHLLEVWDGNAKKQLLTGRNDLRPAAYVALVSALESLGKAGEAKQAARQGIALIDKIIAAAPGPHHVEEQANLARAWLVSKI